MIIKTLVVGAFEVNNYLVFEENSQEAVLIDAGGDYKATRELADRNKVKIKYILNTHGHLDHVAGDYDIQTKEDAKVLLHKDDEFLVKALKQHLALYGMPEYEVPKIDEYIEDGQEIKAGGMTFKVIHTPGHSPGAVCYLIDNILFSGDTLFADSVGRTDLPGGSYEELGNSIKNKLFTLDENITVYPGHGPSTTIKHEKAHNPFFGSQV
ncbi:MAG: hydroxyacylglutathione hydrolase (Glyoxalase II) [uncultured bacterium]|nr:MAG: hydroxyacylglutathione hydrolase (Glyoxalase II) [uncultured bacterium]HBH17971.1 MBL fold metallo-hydrolase [Cyanobacteria bacterium UBA9579]